MSNVIRRPFQPVALEIIAKLIKAGYLHPAAITVLTPSRMQSPR